MGGICWQSVIQSCMLIPLFKRRISSNAAATSASSILPRPMHAAPGSFQREGCKPRRLQVSPFASDLPLLCAGLGGCRRHWSGVSEATLHKPCWLALLPAPGQEGCSGVADRRSYLRSQPRTGLYNVMGSRREASCPAFRCGCPSVAPERSAPAQPSHDADCSPSSLRKSSFPFLQLGSYFSEFTVRGGSSR